MKLTPRAQGYRFTHESWDHGRYVDIRKVGRSEVEAVNDEGNTVRFDRDDMNLGWIRLGSTEKLQGEA